MVQINILIIFGDLFNNYSIYIDYTGKKALQMATLNHMPYGWDDPNLQKLYKDCIMGYVDIEYL